MKNAGGMQYRFNAQQLLVKQKYYLPEPTPAPAPTPSLPKRVIPPQAIIHSPNPPKKVQKPAPTQSLPKLVIQPRAITDFPIPNNIFQTWHTKELSPLMKQATLQLQNSAKGFNYHLFDDEDCRVYIENNFPSDVVDAYNSLVPGAYKADLWRYCVLFKHGGIYIDIKYKPVKGFNLHRLLDRERWVLDRNKNDIYNALMIVQPNNQILQNAINIIVENVNNNFYGQNDLHPTGPGLLGKLFNPQQKKNMSMYHTFFKNLNNRVILLNSTIIFKSYDGYLKEYKQFAKTKHYSQYWKERAIYSSEHVALNI
jgi:mannosyltransferase OCH1-like enzyme